MDSHKARRNTETLARLVSGLKEGDPCPLCGGDLLTCSLGVASRVDEECLVCAECGSQIADVSRVGGSAHRWSSGVAA